MLRLRSPAMLVALSFAGVGCGKKTEEASAAPVASALAPSVLEPAANVWHYAIDTASVTHVDMPGLKEHIQAETSAAAGTLDIVPSDLSRSRGLVRVDLSTLTTHTFADDDKNATQTRHARTWLEAAVDGKVNENMRYADFAIRSIDAASATDLSAVSPTTEGSDEVRTVTMTVHGDLLVHGHKVPKDDVVAATFRYPAGGAHTSKPTRIEVHSKEPLRVVLKEHEVSPRDPAGQLLAWTTSLISKVAETADVTVTLTAVPAP